MQAKENYNKFYAVGLVFTLLLLALVQMYIMREPQRIETVEAHDLLIDIAEGRELYENNCTICHGEDGEGNIGPALNDKNYLKNTSDEMMYNLINSGIPNSGMPTWNQAFGGALTNQQVSQIVAFIRHWEENAPDRMAEAEAVAAAEATTAAEIEANTDKEAEVEATEAAETGDLANGLVVFNQSCAICHGDEGTGDFGPALNNPELFDEYDDDTITSIIADGTPSGDMPGWSSILNSEQIRDIVALLHSWAE